MPALTKIQLYDLKLSVFMSVGTKFFFVEVVKYKVLSEFDSYGSSMYNQSANENNKKLIGQ